MSAGVYAASFSSLYLASAIELSTRGHKVLVFDQGFVPYPDATYTDVSKSIRRTC